MKIKNKIRVLIVAILAFNIMALTGCVYAHNYDENGNEMNKEQVEEAIDDIKESIMNEIDNALSSN